MEGREKEKGGVFFVLDANVFCSYFEFLKGKETVFFWGESG